MERIVGLGILLVGFFGGAGQAGFRQDQAEIRFSRALFPVRDLQVETKLYGTQSNGDRVHLQTVRFASVHRGVLPMLAAAIHSFCLNTPASSANSFEYAWVEGTKKHFRTVRALSFRSASFSELRSNGQDPDTITTEVSGWEGNASTEDFRDVRDHRDRRIPNAFAFEAGGKPLAFAERIQQLRLSIGQGLTSGRKLSAAWIVAKEDMPAANRRMFVTHQPFRFPGTLHLEIGSKTGPALKLTLRNLSGEPDARSGRFARFSAQVVDAESR